MRLFNRSVWKDDIVTTITNSTSMIAYNASTSLAGSNTSMALPGAGGNSTMPVVPDYYVDPTTEFWQWV